MLMAFTVDESQKGPFHKVDNMSSESKTALLLKSIHCYPN